jgi:hypothetical protein
MVGTLGATGGDVRGNDGFMASGDTVGGNALIGVAGAVVGINGADPLRVGASNGAPPRFAIEGGGVGGAGGGTGNGSMTPRAAGRAAFPPEDKEVGAADAKGSITAMN